MRILYYLAYIAGSGVFTLLTWKFFRSVFAKPKVQKDTELLCFSLYFTLTICLQQFTVHMGLRLVGNLLLLGLLTALYEAYWTKKVFSALSLFLFTTFIHYGLIFISGRGHLLLFHPESFNSIIGITLECLFFYLFLALFAFIENHLHSNTAAIISWAAAFLIPLCAALLLCVYLVLVQKEGAFDPLLSFSLLVLVSVNLLALCAYWFRALKTKVELISYQNKYYKNQLDTIEAAEAAFKSLRHDLKNHLVILSNLLKEESPDRAREYLSAMCEQFDSSKGLSNTGNSSIDSLINYKLRSLATHNISLSYRAEIPSKLQIDSFDLTVILGNLLDNALEALERLPASENKKLQLFLKYDRGRLLITVANTYDGVVASSHTGLLTRKKNPLFHGIGLKNVRAAADKYQGHLKISHEQKLFTVHVILYEV